MGPREHVLSWGRGPQRQQKLVQDRINILVLRLSFMLVKTCQMAFASPLAANAESTGATSEPRWWCVNCS